MISIVLTEDHRIVRGGIIGLLKEEPDFEMVGESGDGLETLRLVEERKPDVLVTDLEIPGISGIELIRRVAARFPETRVVVLSMYRDEPFVQSALKAGAMAYVLKESSPDELKAAIRSAHSGVRYLSPDLSQMAFRYYAGGSKDAKKTAYDSLTEREREVLRLLVQGHTNAGIAVKLEVSRRTAESHRASLMRKLGAKNQADMMRIAMQIEDIQLMFKAGGPRHPGRGTPRL